MHKGLRSSARGPAWLGVDQIVSMGSNVLVTAVLVRRGGESALGSFAGVAAVFTVYLVLQRALISEPSAAATASSGESDAALGASSALVMVASTSVALGLLILGLSAWPALMPLALFLPALALEDNGRYMASRLRRPHVAFLMDGTWLAALVVGVLVLPSANGQQVVWMWAVCGGLGLLPGILLARGSGFPVRGLRAAYAWWRVECAVVGRATGLDMIASQIYAQGAVFVTLVTVGLGAAGQYRAAQSLFGACMAAIVAMNMFMLPRVRDNGTTVAAVGRLAWRYLGAVVAVGSITLLLAAPAQKLLFGREVVSPSLRLATFGLFCVLALASAQAVSLRVHAASRTGLLLRSRSLMVLLGLPAMFLAGRAGSLPTLVWAQAAGVGVFVTVTFLALRGRPSTPRRAAAPKRRRVSPFVVHMAAATTPWVDVAYCVGRGLLAARPGRETELVIEGFPRSANTYARAAFLDANPGVAIASHLHSARSVRRAVRLHVPVIVLVRDPLDAVASLMVRDRRVHPWSALKAYERFYRGVLPVRDRVVVTRFSDVTDDFASVIDRVNSVAGTQFLPYRPDGVTEARVHAEIDRMERVFAGGALDETAVSRPSGQRLEMSHEVRALLGRPEYQDLIAECRRLHDHVLAPSLSRQSR